jgi:hypothetical protein
VTKSNEGTSLPDLIRQSVLLYAAKNTSVQFVRWI